MAKRKKRAAASRSSRKKRAPLKRRTAAKRQTTANRRTATKRRTTAKRQSATKRRSAPRRSSTSKRRHIDPRVRGDIMLVGSLPFETVEEGAPSSRIEARRRCYSNPRRRSRSA